MKCSYCGEEYISGTRQCSCCHMPVEEAFGIISNEYLKQDIKEYKIDNIQEQIVEKIQQVQQEQIIEQKELNNNQQQVSEEDENEFITLLNIPTKKQEQANKEQIIISPQQIVDQNQQINNIEQVSQKVPVQEQQAGVEKPVEFPKPSTVITSNQNTITIDNNKKKEKDKDGIKLRRKIVAFAVVLLVCGFVTWKVVGNNNQKLQTNNQNAAIATEGNSIDYLGYKLTIPEGFIYNKYNGTDYIQDDDFVVMFKEESPLSYSYVMENKDSIIASLNAQGLNVKSFESKNLYGNDYVLIIGDKGEDKKEYGYMFGDLGGTNPICATIRANSSDKFNTEWFSTTAMFFATAKK